MSASARVLAPEIPLHSLGAGATGPLVVRNRRPSRTMYAPRTPLYQLGYYELAGLGSGAQIVGATAPIAAVGTTMAITAAAGGSAAAAGTTAGAVAGPIGAAVGAIIGIVAGLMAAHELRVKQAKNENAAVNLGVPGFDQGLRQLQQAYKAGTISAADVQQGVSVLLQNFWQEVAPNIQPGRNGCNSGASCPPDTSASGRQPCQGNIGAACCVGCYPLTESITNPDGVLAALAGQSTSKGGPFTAQIMAVGASKYGTSYRAPYSLDFTPPPPAPAGSSITSGLTSLVDSITGLPVSAAAGAPSSLMPLLLIGAALYLVSR
jgi:hypothetical protein